VIVLIGPNDSSSKTRKFDAAYTSLLNLIVARYSPLPRPPKIISVCGGSINGLDPCENIQAVTAAFNSGRSADGDSDGWVASYVTIDEADWKNINNKWNGFLGCDEHYAESGHEVLMKDIEGQVRDVLGWQR